MTIPAILSGYKTTFGTKGKFYVIRLLARDKEQFFAHNSKTKEDNEKIITQRILFASRYTSIQNFRSLSRKNFARANARRRANIKDDRLKLL